ncbi:anthranilate synthase component II [Schizosaccharomyces octosporus yFS286]|uniref:Multifunctional tryptophan biosynthesis protein n=1 Tax=Schizosaccharomyces octosporus (strain yFS286) TaxID=483514 RepID=S9RFM9_SCHOY|nr:anthranilate synthase component II [Schizosaccharomyces octosporus yFS286]EPX72889.1 anthranilate synthase component II [Schizosaccharomyces octosporus yFS286]
MTQHEVPTQEPSETKIVLEGEPERPIVMIDNYDSFTWNIVQYLSNLEKRYPILVIRNDELTVDELEQLKPLKLILSPGPGHPAHDGGICNEAISRFAGKIPIFGVCMGLQCLFESMGGNVESAGEIIHGKVSKVYHDGLGLFQGIPQGISVTRYHSLAGTIKSLPADLEVTCWTENGIIMGARHKKFAIEGVQYHPESILSEYGKEYLQNFLNLTAGTWEENNVIMPTKNDSFNKAMKERSNTVSFSSAAAPENVPKLSILNKIHAQRLIDVAKSKCEKGHSVNDLQTYLKMNLTYPVVNFYDRLKKSTPALMAEVKRASPSKGDIDPYANAAQQALIYANAGASVISVLTEPKWFKGSLDDLQLARRAVDQVADRPAILRKDFIIDPYQIMEARLNGADSVLLIVAMLSYEQLESLYKFAKSLDMEPLVEVNCASEMEIAIKLGAKVIGVNNRNLHNFEVDLSNTSKLVDMVPKDVVLAALSGISSRSDVELYTKQGVSAVLVGESLMRASDPAAFAQELLHGASKKEGSDGSSKPLVKVCGTRTVPAAKTIIESGGDLIGLIFADKSKRRVDLQVAKDIVELAHSNVRHYRDMGSPCDKQKDWFGYQFQKIANSRHPLVVGVFKNQPLEYIKEVLSAVDLDIVQLHGQEPLQWAEELQKPVFKVFSPNASELSSPNYHVLPLVDAFVGGQSGGLGKTVDWKAAAQIKIPYVLAGGLTPDNVQEAICTSHAAIVDVSSGVETEGIQDDEKIKRFIQNAKKC